MKFTYLLDSSVLIALSDETHTAHRVATAWFANMGGRFATCPITQMALLRYTLRINPGSLFQDVKQLLRLITSMPGHEFWADTTNCLSLPDKGILGHGHVTDSYLVDLAKSNGGRIATLDRRMADVFSATAQLVS